MRWLLRQRHGEGHGQRQQRQRDQGRRRRHHGVRTSVRWSDDGYL
jgi:hypothetical protein